MSVAKLRNVVLVDGCRIPFTLAGTAYKNYMAVDLGIIYFAPKISIF